MAVRRIEFQGRSVQGIDVAFRIVDDGSITLELEDGARLRLRHVVFNVIKTDERTAEGERVYMVQSLNHVVALQPAKDDEQ